MRSQLPTLELDAVFEAKEEVAVDVKNSLTEIMTTYGYQIVQVRENCSSSLSLSETSNSPLSCFAMHVDEIASLSM